MKSKLLIYSILGILLSLSLQSCDPDWAIDPECNASLVMFNGLGYPVSLKSNYDIRNRCLYTDGEREQTIQPFDTIHLVSNLPVGTVLSFSFEIFWKNSITEPIHYRYRLYKLNPETYEEEEMLKEWKEGSDFFEQKSWKLKEVEGATKDHPVASDEWTYYLNEIKSSDL